MPVWVRFEISGVVQGVGFRPFVHRLANELGVAGLVGNDAAQVFIEAAAEGEVLDVFQQRLVDDAPPLAVVEEIRRVGSRRRVEPDAGFVIVDSVAGPSGVGRTFVSPDTAVCDDCLRELFDPGDRRFGHPFITCTNCGPRFTITRALPYDRASTTMAEFEMCPRCRAEYHDPSDRRFHAQPIGCHDCGPVLQWWQPAGQVSPQVDPIAKARRMLADGAVLAVKGLGGFHLMTSAVDDQAVAELRARKHRPDKPFAVMVADLAAARSIADLTAAECDLLASRERPIVLCRVRHDAPLASSVAPGNPLVGVMLPHTPLHHLLFTPLEQAPLGPMVMTSGNRSGEPICHRDTDVVSRLGPLVDGIVTHDRPIHVPCDDSVVRVTSRGVLPIRRSRGHAPMPLSLPCDPGRETSPTAVLAVGGELKNAFCISNGTHAWMSQHIGDMENLETLDAFAASVDQFRRLYAIDPEVVAADTHPAYRSSGWARTNHGDRVVEVQHHHAHVASVMAEHGLAPSVPVLGVVFDGTGDGTDGTIWGGELLVATAARAERVGHLRHTPLPGGDAAIRHPSRVALSHLWTAGIDWEGTAPAVATSRLELDLLARQLERGVNCIPTSSMGRFFDALASLVGLRHSISYEAQAAIEFEILAASWTGKTPVLPFALGDPTPLLAAVCDAMSAGVSPAVLARACHRAMASGVAVEVSEIASEQGIGTVVLSGGVFQNVLFTDLLTADLERRGLDVRSHRLVPPNDGGLALGQVMVARARVDRDRALSVPTINQTAGV